MEQLTIGTVVQHKNSAERQYIVVEVLKNAVRCININFLTKYSSTSYFFNKNTIKIVRQLNKQELEIINSKLKLFISSPNLKIRK